MILIRDQNRTVNPTFSSIIYAGLKEKGISQAEETGATMGALHIQSCGKYDISNLQTMML
jgi:hypothetical protein